jgi:hypothetical protein
MSSYQEGVSGSLLGASKEAYNTATTPQPPPIPERLSTLVDQVISIIIELRSAAAKLGYQPPMPSADRINGSSVNDRINALSAGAEIMLDLAQNIDRRL